MTQTTHFGFRSVDEDEKATLVRGVFDSVASRYDVMNDLMSARLHRLWKNDMVAGSVRGMACASSMWRVAPAISLSAC